MPRSPEWRINFIELQRLLKDLDAYVECGDWVNVNHIRKILMFKVNMYPQYEEERSKKK